MTAYFQVLNSHVPHGQKSFEELKSAEYAAVNGEVKELEDLRYRWSLYKAKLCEAGEYLVCPDTAHRNSTNFTLKTLHWFWFLCA